MTPMEFLTPNELPPTNGYSHVAVIPPNSRLVWTSGQVPLTSEGQIVAPGDWEAQTRAVLLNIEAALHAAGANWHNVFKLTIYVTDTSALAVVRKVRDEFIDLEHPPTSSLVQVAALFHPEVLIEIEAIAALPGDSIPVRE